MKRKTFSIVRYDLERDGYYVQIEPSSPHLFEVWLYNIDIPNKRKLVTTLKDTVPEEKWENFVLKYIDETIKRFENDENVFDYFQIDLYEIINLYNDHADAMQNLAEKLIETYPDVESTPVNEAFCEAFNSMGAEATELCCEANAVEDKPKWSTTESWHVVVE